MIEPNEYAKLASQWRSYASSRRRNIFGYVDTRDLGHFIDYILAANKLSYQIFNVANIVSLIVTERVELE